MKVDLAVQRAISFATTPEDRQFRLWAALAVARGAAEQDGSTFTLAIRIVDEEEGRRFNRQYRGKDHASNVLSFPAELPEGLPLSIQPAPLGDLLMSAPVVAREAKEQGKPEINHWAHLTIHGVLHLLGYDHQHEAVACEMEKLEAEILAGLGISDPY